jgi:sorting nexin-1/2
LKNALSSNWPGIYIPSVPPKKAIGNKDIEFIVERRYFLERFFL